MTPTLIVISRLGSAVKSSYYSGLISAGPETGCDRITPSLPSAESDLNSDVGFRCDSVPWILGSDGSIFYTHFQYYMRK